MPKKKPKQHGGPRANSGRKPIAPEGSTLIGASLPTELVERLDAYAARHEMTRAKAVREAVTMLLNAE